MDSPSFYLQGNQVPLCLVFLVPQWHPASEKYTTNTDTLAQDLQAKWRHILKLFYYIAPSCPAIIRRPFYTDGYTNFGRLPSRSRHVVDCRLSITTRTRRSSQVPLAFLYPSLPPRKVAALLG